MPDPSVKSVSALSRRLQIKRQTEHGGKLWCYNLSLAGCYSNMAVLNFSHIIPSVDDSGQSGVSDCTLT